MTDKQYMQDWYSKNKELVKLQKAVCRGCGRHPRGRRCKDWEFCVSQFHEKALKEQSKTVSNHREGPVTTDTVQTVKGAVSLLTSEKSPILMRMVTDDGVNPADALFYIADTLRDIHNEMKEINAGLKRLCPTEES